MSSILDAYQRISPQSRVAFDRAKNALAGGTSRQASMWLPYPITMDHGSGTQLIDLDGNGYIDLLGNHASLAHGHGFAPVVEAVKAQLSRGTAWSANNEAQAALAELIKSRVASIERVRFANSGTEAANLAMSIARAYTGRRKILMARYGYHGTLPETLAATQNKHHDDALLADYGDTEAFLAALDTHGSDIAAVIIEPMLNAGSVIQAPREFYLSVQKAAERAGALFILDEVITFRLAYGGHQSNIQISPDLTMLGKVIGGGFPVGAVGGRADIMGLFEAATPIAYSSGTFSGNPVTMVAGHAAITHLTEAEISRLDRLANRLKSGLLQKAGQVGLPLSIRSSGSLLHMFLMDEAPLPGARTDLEAMAQFYLAAFVHGAFMGPRGWMAISTAFDETVIDDAIERLGGAMKMVAEALEEHRGATSEKEKA